MSWTSYLKAIVGIHVHIILYESTWHVQNHQIYEPGCVSIGQKSYPGLTTNRNPNLGIRSSIVSMYDNQPTQIPNSRIRFLN